MSGIAQTIIANGWSLNLSVTVGSDTPGNNFHGYSDGSGTAQAYGSLSGTSSFGSGQTVTVLDSSSLIGSYDFRIRIKNVGAIGSNFFSHLAVFDHNSLKRVYRAVDATFTNDSGDGVWLWGDGSSDVWVTLTEGNVRNVVVYK